ncbi:MAG TPA: GNAT family N-acetyltransferase [Conexibacter sp.]
MQTSPIRIERSSPTAPLAASLLVDYGAELVARGRPFSPLEPPPGQRPASWVEPDELEPPGGVFLLAQDGELPVGCGGLRTLAADLGEVKRMYVVPTARRRGVARRILSELEDVARELGRARVRLDTNAVQPEAVALYHACGYREIADYNGNPYATHWFEKHLSRDGHARD